MNYPELSLMEFVQSIEIGALCRQVTCGLGPPGIGKTQAVYDLAVKLGKQFLPIEFGLVSEEEAAGLFWRNPETGKIERVPIGVMRRACEEPGILLADEVTRCTQQRQSGLMTLSDGQRRIGDAVLHPETIVVLAGNGDESAGTHGLVDALIGRVNMATVVAKRAEVGAYLRTRVGAPGSTLRELAIDYAATAEHRPALISEVPPKGFSDTKISYPSPRNICNGLTRVAAMIDAGGDVTSNVGFAQLGGNVGIETAAMFLSMRKLRAKLPTVAEIVKDPEHAKIPPDTESGIAALGLIANAAEQSANAAWLYSARLGDAEIQAAITRSMLSKVPTDPKALGAFNTLTGRAARSMKRTA